MISHLPLLKKLTLRGIKVRYKQSYLGYFWIMLNPLLQMIIMSFIFSNILGRATDLSVPYPIFLYSGLLPWIFFSTTLSSSMGTLSGNASLLKKIYFPREILVLSEVFSKAVDFFLSSVVFVVLMIVFNVDFHLNMILFFPVFIIQALFVYGLSLLLSAMNLFYRDVQYLFTLILRLWFYMTPIIYAVEFFPEKYHWIFKLNPMSAFVNAYREVLLTDTVPNWTNLAIGVGISVVVFLVSYKIFKKLEGTFADVV